MKRPKGRPRIKFSDPDRLEITKDEVQHRKSRLAICHTIKPKKPKIKWSDV